MTDIIYTCTAPKDYKSSDCWDRTRCSMCKYRKPKFTKDEEETTNMKCAICGHELACDDPKDEKLVELLYCPTCKNFMLGNYRIWEELERKQKQLEIAINTLESIRIGCGMGTIAENQADVGLREITKIKEVNNE